MIRLCFVRGSSIRRVFINGRKISFMAPETGNKPVVMDLDKIHLPEIRKKFNKEQLKEIKEIAKLETEEDMAKDIKTDYQRIGWRLFKRD